MISRELLVKLTYGQGVTAILSKCIVLLLFTGSFAAISITFSTAFAYSTVITNSSINKEIPAQVKNFILNQIVNKSKAAIVVGFVDPNGTRIFSFGNMSKAHNIPVNENTLFDIGSITKTFTTLLLADMVDRGIVKLTDPIEKYLPTSVKVPEFKGHKITLEDLATHTSGLPFLPSNIWVSNKVGVINSNYTTNQLYTAISNFTLTREPGSKFQYSDLGLGLLGHVLSLKAGVPYEQLIKDRILNVLGMNDTKITLSQDDIKNRFPVGHHNGKEINTPIIAAVIEGAGAFRSTASDLLKYVSANLGVLHTKLDAAIQLQHLIRHPGINANPMNYAEYVALGWRVLTNFGTETLAHTGSINGWDAFVGFTPTKHIGVVLLCSCDSRDVDMSSLGFVLLHLAGTENLTAKTES
ncbi:MAG: serine hydrolase domain-containing protein [Nitrososphaeraceae archaeon]